MSQIFVWESEVRDYETDLQGIVAHANYANYMMHARHIHIKELGIDFAKMHDEGFNLVMVHADITYKASLVSGDHYKVLTQLKPCGRIKFVFEQEIYRIEDDKLIIQAVNTATCVDINRGRPVMPEVLKAVLRG